MIHPIASWLRYLPLVGLLACCTMAAAQGPVDPFRGAGGTTAAPEARLASSEFVDAPITNIFRMISDMTGWSIMMSPELTKTPPKVNLWIRGLTPDQVLEQVADLAGLIIQRTGKTVKVMTFDEYTKLYGVDKQVVPLKYAEAPRLVAVLRPLAEKTEAKVVADDNSNQLVLLAPKPLMDSMLRLVAALDRANEQETVEVVRLEHLDAATAATNLESFLKRSDTRTTLSGRPLPFAPPGTGGVPEADKESTAPGESWVVQFMVETRLNAIIMRGRKGHVARAKELVEKLDIEPQLKVVSYALKSTAADEALATLQTMLKPEGNREQLRVKLAASRANNSVVIEASASDQHRLAAIIEELDRPLAPGSGGVRVYRLENTSADAVVKILQDLISGTPSQSTSTNGASRFSPGYGPNRGSSSGTVAPIAQPLRLAPGAGPSSVAPGSAARPSEAPPGAPPPGGPSPAAPTSTDELIRAQVTAAPEINAVIVRASADEQQQLGTIIRELDRPRPQVMIEITLVTLDNADRLNLGVELAGATVGDNRVNQIGFTQFGIGTVDPAAGKLRLAAKPPFGFNYAIFNNEDFSVVVNALRSRGDTRITSIPRILVEDNTMARISRLNEEPTSNTSQGTSTTVTAFNGFVDAGTTMAVIPHVSEQNSLRLEYQIQLSSFGSRTAEQLAANLPPPRETNDVSGVVRIPADHTVVLGGLIGKRRDRSVDGIPGLMDIPGLGELFKKRSNSDTEETLFIFVRPLVLQDPWFKDLVNLSRDDIRRAKVSQAGDLINPMKTRLSVPTTQPLEVQ